MANESALRGRVSGWLREEQFFVQPIETGAIMEGVPDLWYAHANGANGWLELKRIKEMPKRSTTAVFRSLNHPLSTAQANWIEVCLEHGVRANILVAHERDYFLVPGEMAHHMNDYTEEDIRAFTIKKKDIILRLLQK